MVPGLVLSLCLCILCYHFIPLSANPTKWSNTLKQFAGNFPTNWECLTILWGWSLNGYIAMRPHKSLHLIITKPPFLQIMQYRISNLFPSWQIKREIFDISLVYLIYTNYNTNQIQNRCFEILNPNSVICNTLNKLDTPFSVLVSTIIFLLLTYA